MKFTNYPTFSANYMKSIQVIWNIVSVAMLIVLGVMRWDDRESLRRLASKLETANKPSASSRIPRPPVEGEGRSTPSANTNETQALPAGESKPKLPDFSTGNPVLDRLLTRRLGWALLGRNEGQLAGVHLSAEKKEKLRGLLLEKAHDERNLTDAAVRKSLSALQQATAKKDLVSSYEAAIEAALGSEDYIQYQKDMAEFSFKNGVIKSGEIPGCFLEAKCPLSNDQADALYSLIYRTNESTMAQATSPSRPAVRAEVLAKAKEFLSSEQLMALSGYYEADDRVAEEMGKLGK